MARLIPIEEAMARVRLRCHPVGTTRIRLANSLRRVLAQSVRSDIDSPPFDKSLVDGFAVRSDDLRAGRHRLQVIERVSAGQVPGEPVRPGVAIQIMTGVQIPAGADAVVMVEQTRLNDDQSVQILAPTIRPGEHILRQGAAMAAQTELLRPGQVIGPAQVGLLAEAGLERVEVYRIPRVAALQTGDELVEHDERPLVGQIRNSNGPMIRAAIHASGGEPIDLGIARDDAKSLLDRVQAGLRQDMLVICGGVSAGVKDFVPGVLAQAGVEPVFHKVALRPGKPIWFGQFAHPDRPPTLVFGLPGNPVSSLVGFLLLARPAVQMLGGAHPRWQVADGVARLDRPFRLRGGRPTLWPARRSERPDNFASDLPCAIEQWVEPLPWQGSADLLQPARADRLIYFPTGSDAYDAGETLPVKRLDGLLGID